MGKLVIYTGPMKSGKTTKLIEQYGKVSQRSVKTHMFKPSIDDRYSSVKVIARNNDNQILSTLLNDLDMLWYFKDMYNNFFIDEFQFLSGNICAINKLLDEDYNLYIGGLNLTAEKKPFGKMGDLLCLANTIYLLKGNCDYCGNDNGIFTLYNGIKNQDIVVGEDDYKCVCSNCYKHHSNF